MNIIIHQEVEEHNSVFKLIKKSFEGALSDHKEQFLVEILRTSQAFIPKLSMVAELNGVIVGHILLTKVHIKNDNSRYESLALAPVTVLPEYQKRGIGEKLIKAAHHKAKELGFCSVVLLGHENYYPRFGYKPSDYYGIKFPFDAPAKNCMAIELVPDALSDVSGTVEYPKEFFQ